MKRWSTNKSYWKCFRVAAALAAVGYLLVPACCLLHPALMAAEPASMVGSASPVRLDPVSPDLGCPPEKRIPRASPVVLANVLYTAFPAGLSPATEGKAPVGRMAAVRIYDPGNPAQTLTGDQILWEAGQVLAAGEPHERRILFADAGVRKPFTGQHVTASMLALDTAATGSGRLRCDFNADGTIDSGDVQWLIQWIRQPRRAGAGQSSDWLLGAVDRSVPALMVPPQAAAGRSGAEQDGCRQQRYARFATANRERRTVLFVGSADGLLHAIDAGSFRWGDNPATPDITEQRGYFRWGAITVDSPDYCFSYEVRCPDYGTGRELWSFIPANLLPRLKYHLLDGGEPANMNASPTIADVYLDTDDDGIGDTWRTVLLSAQGTGGEGVFCLDVTDPLQPALLWEYAAAELVRRQAAPAVVRIGRILHAPTGRPRWAAFVVAGASEASRHFPAVLILDVFTGELLERIVLDAPVDRNGDGLLQPDDIDYGKYGVAGSRPAVIDSDQNGLIDRIYVSADSGLVYKILVPDEPGNRAAGITGCVLNTDFSTADGRVLPAQRRYQPVTVSPTVVVDGQAPPGADGTRRVWVFFGTGGSTRIQDQWISAAARHHFFAYTDDAGKRDCRPNRHRLQWFMALNPGDHLLAPAFAAAGRVYFGTAATDRAAACGSRPDSDAEPRELVVADLDGAVLFRRPIPELLGPPLVEDLHLYVTLPGGVRSFGLGIYNNPLQLTTRLQVRVKVWQELE